MVFFFAKAFSRSEQCIRSIYDTIVSLIKVFLLSRKVSLPVAMQADCFILGNGPSLNTTLEIEEDRIKTSSLFCVNHFCLSPQFKILRPENYVFLDINFFSDNGHERDPNVLNTLRTLELDTSWPLNLFVPGLARKAKRLLAIQRSNNNITIRYYNYTLAKGIKAICFGLYKRNLAMPQCQNVLGACIFLALNSGYKNIFVAGADHTWVQNLIVGNDNNLYMKHQHFYSAATDQPTLYPIYRSQLSYEKMPLDEYFLACAKTFHVYHVLEDYSHGLGSRIFNITPGSYIDAFERKSQV